MPEIHTFDVTTANFDQDVVQRSQEISILLMHWSPHSSHCQTLASSLTKVMPRYREKVLLGKVDVELNQDLATKLSIENVPSVQLIYEGQILAEFQGAVTEEQLRQFIAEHCPSDADFLLKDGLRYMEEKNYSLAFESFEKAAQLDTGKEEALVGQIRSLLYLKRWDEAKAFLDSLPREKLSLLNLDELISLIDEALIVNTNPEPIDASSVDTYYYQAMQTILQQDWEAALQKLLDVIKVDKAYRNGAAKKFMLTIFNELGTKHPSTIRYQKLLARYLY